MLPTNTTVEEVDWFLRRRDISIRVLPAPTSSMLETQPENGQPKQSGNHGREGTQSPRDQHGERYKQGNDDDCQMGDRPCARLFHQLASCLGRTVKVCFQQWFMPIF